MSLLPNEQRVLDRIEASLASSDPRLATMLTTFTPPLTGRVIVRTNRLFESRPGRWLAGIAVAVVMIALLATAWLTSGPARPVICRPGAIRSTTSSPIDALRLSGACRPTAAPSG
jgi:hypothetical protein